MSNDITDENPFSFKHFIKSKSEAASSDLTEDGIPDEVNIKNHELPFPEVGDAAVVVKKKNKGKDGKKTSQIKGKLLDSSDNLENDNPFSFKNFVKKDAALKTGGRVLQIINDEISEVENNVNTVQANNSEPATKVNIEVLKDDYNSESLDAQIETSGEIAKLKEENEKLQRQLKEIKHLKECETARAESLVKKLKEMQQKENEETVALEKMVHMVEKNLELTTQRAAQAEAINVKLKEENKILKNNSVSRAMYDDLVTRHQSYISSIKDQALSVSQNLDATAKKAEESLRQLYSGADALKLASQLLTSIDKFTNLQEDLDNRDEAQ